MVGESVLFGLVVFAFLLWRQLQVRRLREGRSWLIAGALVVVGVLEVTRYLAGHHVAHAALALIGVSFLVGIGFGAVRARTVKIWRQESTVVTQGTWLTIALWLVTVAVHFAIDLMVDASSRNGAQAGAAAILIYLGLTLGAQRLVVFARARDIRPQAALA